MVDILLVASIITIWISVMESVVIMAGAVIFLRKQYNKPLVAPENMESFPTVSVMVPAHNEELVITATVEHILQMNYPADKMQVIVVADNCQDQTAAKLRELHASESYKDRNLVILERTGTGGKSGALNDALKRATGEWICVYDADAAPEKNALLFLTQKALEDPEQYGAVFGRNKARNRGQNFLSRCINLEIVTNQRVHHTGLWQLFKLGMIPGTNFIIKSSLLRELGGWDEDAITEDTALSFEILGRGQLIALAPQAEAYQQEPEDFRVYMKQRERWAKGNYSVVTKHIHQLFNRSTWRVKLNVLYYATNYFWFMIAIIISDILFLVNMGYLIASLFQPDITSPFQFQRDVYIYLVIAWALMYFLYVLQNNLALAADIGQSNIRNFILSCISYFTYAQLFIIISCKSVVSMALDKVFGRKSTWYKTQRFG